MSTSWGKINQLKHTERRGLIKPTPEDGRFIEIVVRGRLGGMGSRWGWELAGNGGLSAKRLYVHETEDAAMADAELVGLALLQIPLS